MIVIIGSTAFKFYKPDKEIKDLDVVGEYDEVIEYVRTLSSGYGVIKSIYPIQDGKKLVVKFKNKICEAEINWGHDSVKLMQEMVLNDEDTIKENGFAIPPLDFLYTLKMTHRYLKNSPFFLKTMHDIQTMRKMGARIRPEYNEFFKLREKETYNYNHPKLNVKKKDFFTGDGVKYVYDHDSIHEAVKHLDKPAYKYYQVGEVMCSKQDFFSAEKRVRLFGVLEEAYVLALERSQIPFKSQLTPRKSFEMGLQKICTSITSGFFREYAYDNYDEIMGLYDDSYADKFWEKVSEGKVKLA